MNPAGSFLPRLDEGLATLSADKELVLCDVWGVIHNGVHAFEPAVDALRRFRRGGGTVVLITNAPVPHMQVRDRLDRLDVPHDAYDHVATAGDVAVDLIVEAGCPPMFTIGPENDVAIYREAARLHGRPPRQVDVAHAALALCVGLDDTGEQPSDYDGILAKMRARDLKLICANPDIVVEVGRELVYCAGAIAERYVALGGTVVQTGKPHTVLYDHAIALAAAAGTAPPRSRMLAIGDGLATDIAGAAAQGIASVFVTGGIHRAQLHRRTGGSTAGSALDRASLARFIDANAARPDAALPYLVW